MIQQVLNEPKTLEKFIPKDEVNQFLDCFVGIWKINKENQEVINHAIQNPGKYVMKQQREGGGNLIWGDKMKEILESNDEEKGHYILMERIEPKSFDTNFVKNQKLEIAQGITELGIYGSFLGDGKQVFHNEYSGYLLRSKKEGMEDGGVVAGVMYLDSVALSNE